MAGLFESLRARLDQSVQVDDVEMSDIRLVDGVAIVKPANCTTRTLNVDIVELRNIDTCEGSVTEEIVDDIRNMGIIFLHIPYSYIFQTIFLYSVFRSHSCIFLAISPYS